MKKHTIEIKDEETMNKIKSFAKKTNMSIDKAFEHMINEAYLLNYLVLKLEKAKRKSI